MGRLAYEGQAPGRDEDVPTTPKWKEPLLQEGSSPEGAGDLTGGNAKQYQETHGMKAEQDLESPGSAGFTRKTDKALGK